MNGIEKRLVKLEARHEPNERLFTMTTDLGEVIALNASEIAEIMRAIDGKTKGLP